jgi:hypothetical protein
MRSAMPNRRAETETGAAVGRDESPREVQMTRAFIAVAAGLLLAFWMLRPLCANPNVRTALPEQRALSGIRTLVI